MKISTKSWRYRRQEIDKSMAVVYSLLTDRGGGEATPPDANWCRTCDKHRNDPMAIFCRDGCHDKLRKTNTTPPTPSAPVGVEGLTRWSTNGPRTNGGMYVDPAGKWVRYDDVAALTPAATYATPDDVALNMGPDDVPRLLIAGAQVARFPKGSWTEVCKAFDFAAQPAAREDGLHPDWQACTTLEELADGLAGNALAGYQAAMRKDAMACLIRAQQLAASRQGAEGWTIQVDSDGIWATDPDGSSIWLAVAPTQEKGNG